MTAQQQQISAFDALHSEIARRSAAILARGGFDIDAAAIRLMTSEPFYSAISRYVRKVENPNVPTLGITSDGTNVMMVFNPTFMRTLSMEHVQGVLRHELMHFVLLHLVERTMEHKVVWNFATDLAINSMIGEANLPAFVLMPGRRLSSDEETRKAWTPEQLKSYDALSTLIASFPLMQSAEWYYAQLLADPSASGALNGNSITVIVDGDGGDNSQSSAGRLDSHSGWDDVPPELRDMLREKIRAITRSAISEADSSASGWGSVPEHMRSMLRRLVSNQVNWKSLLRSFVGFSQRAEREHTRMRPHRKYGITHPGTRRGHQASIAVCVDQSGSVDDDTLALLIAELEQLSRIATFTIVPFDHAVNESAIIEWRRGCRMELQRTCCGGTSFDAPTAWVNSHAFDGMIVLTDGQAPAPEASKCRRAWLLAPACTLAFETRELTITMEQKPQGP